MMIDNICGPAKLGNMYNSDLKGGKINVEKYFITDGCFSN